MLPPQRPPGELTGVPSPQLAAHATRRIASHRHADMGDLITAG
jgi:hypothetical protein